MDQSQNNSSPTPAPVPTPGPTPTPIASASTLGNTVPAFMTADSSLASDNSTPPTPPKVSNSAKKNILALGGVLALVVGMFMSLAFVRQRNITQTQAWDCSAYGFTVENDGTIKAFNNSSRDERSQKVSISINGAPAGIFDVPALNKGDNQVIGKVNVPTSGSFTWSAVGEKDCQNSGTNQVQSAKCEVKFDESDKLYCSQSETQVTVTGTVVSAPTGATLETSSYIVQPNSTQPVYHTQPTSSGQKFSITQEWPGIKSSDTLVEIHFGFNMRDAAGNLIANCNGGLDYYWTKKNAGSCPITTPKPSATPTKTPTPRPSATPTARPSATPKPSSTPMPTTPPTGGGPTSTPMPSNTPAPSATPGPSSTPIPSATPAPTTYAGQPNSCNGTCGSDSNCQSGLTCYRGYCRRSDNPSDSNCTSPVTASNNPAPTSKPVTEIPQSGSTSYTLITIVAGAILLGAGALFAL